MKARTFLLAIFSLAVLTSGSVFSENPSADQTKSALKSWLQGLYHKLTSPAAGPVTIDDSRPQPIPGKSVVIYYGNHPEVVSLGATNRAALVKPYGQTK
jgi:hypothetical protein